MNWQLFDLMQIAGGTFPSGAFSQSWGLETYIYEKRIRDAKSVSDFLETYLESNIGKCEGPIVRRAFELAEPLDEDSISELENLSIAVKLTKESREANMRMGKAIMRVMKEVLPGPQLMALKTALGGNSISYPVAYGAICRYMGADAAGTLQGFVFSTLNALVQSAVKLIPLGNTEAQKIIFDSRSIMEKTVKCSMETSIEDIANFCPALDMASIKHESLPVRLYMS